MIPINIINYKMWEYRSSAQCLDETVLKMLEENKPYKKHLYKNYILYELDHPFIHNGRENDFGCPGDFLTIIVVQEHKKPWACQCHQFTFKGAKFVVCENMNYSVFRLENIDNYKMNTIS